jgi:hypothetical protein
MTSTADNSYSAQKSLRLGAAAVSCFAVLALGSTAQAASMPIRAPAKAHAVTVRDLPRAQAPCVASAAGGGGRERHGRYVFSRTPVRGRVLMRFTRDAAAARGFFVCPAGPVATIVRHDDNRVHIASTRTTDATLQIVLIR